ncbi:MAG: ferrous iron transport protein B [Ruminococcus sp.]|nr:ferrous iron transport protein B [Ruminococcus sp.]
MGISIALAGNPNCGKTTLFNALTGANQYVGNWPGVTVEKKEGKFKGDKEVIITDLPGIYSLSPYTLEEVVARNYLIEEHPDAILNIIDGTNLERNLYLTTQLVELGIPVVVAVNMTDVLEKNGDKVYLDKLEKALGCKVCSISALKGTGITEAAGLAIEVAKSKKAVDIQHKFADNVEKALSGIEGKFLKDAGADLRRWYAVKLFERDDKVLERLSIDSAELDKFIEPVEKEEDDDSESIITNERYTYITSIIDSCIKKKDPGGLTLSDKIDRVVTNRFAALPIFALVMFIVYYVSVTTVGGWATDWTNDVFAGEWLQGGAEKLMDNLGVASWLKGLVVDGIVGGVGAVLGFVPQILVLFLFLAFLEGCGYMARVAFVMDRIFRKFGLSGKSFIPMLIGTGCGIPGIMASRTIENERDRRMTVITTTFIPCSAKLPIIAMIAGAFFDNQGWVATSAYFVGVCAIVVSGIILKKTKIFSGDPAPFVMELPAYHMPTVGSILRSMWERGWSFIKKAGTVILLSSVALWFLQGYGFEDGSFGECELDNSLLARFGKAIQWLFAPLGWGDWKFAVGTVTGLIAKENVVATFGVLMNGIEEAAEDDPELLSTLSGLLPGLAAYSFMVFNLLCAPCFAAMGAIKREMNNGKWTAFAITYQCVFAYVISLIVYQIGSLFTSAVETNIAGVIAAFVLLAGLIYLLVRPYKESEKLTIKVKAKA